MDHTEIAIVGAGLIGLAVARALAQTGRSVIILEAASTFGTGTSSRNSEVIHAGIYYPPDSLKARFCRRGRELLLDYCQRHGIAHRQCGKLVVATQETEAGQLEAIATRAAANGALLQTLSGREALAMEPALQAVAALWSPGSGIVDSHGLMLTLLGEAENAGALLAVNTPFIRAEAQSDGSWQVGTGGREAYAFSCRWLINCAGLHAQAVAGAMAGFPAEHIPPLQLAKGNYFALGGKTPFSRLIYPVPVPGGLGIHLTLDLGGQARFGPDVEWLAHANPDQVDYQVSPQRSAAFEQEIRRYWPTLPPNALQPAYSGVRPKLPAGSVDFHIAGPAQHGVAGAVQLMGIESPGLTSALAIGEYVAAIVQAGT